MIRLERVRCGERVEVGRGCLHGICSAATANSIYCHGILLVVCGHATLWSVMSWKGASDARKYTIQVPESDMLCCVRVTSQFQSQVSLSAR